MQIHENILQTIGNTPLVRLHHVTEGLAADLVVKIESFNPGGSVKDRPALKMIEDAEQAGLLQPGGTIIEGTSGNTGMGLALVASIRGYRCIFVMPDKMSSEKINLLKAFGAEVIVTPTAVEPEDPRSYYSVSRRLSEEIPGSYFPNQYANPSNPQSHYESTGPELWAQTDGRITHFIAGMGTGGTLTGIARYLKEQNPKIQVIGVDPIGSLYHEFFHHGKVTKAESYLVEGIGEDFFPKTMELERLDDVVQVNDKSCFMMARDLARKEGIFTGGSGGAAVAGAIEYARRMAPEEAHKALVVVLLPDTGRGYISKVFNDEWLRENRMLEPRRAESAGQLLERKQGRVSGFVSVEPQATCAQAAELIKSFDISQVPVIDSTHPLEILGTFNEDRMIDLMLQGRALREIFVREAMLPPLPIIAEDAHLADIATTLSHGTPAVIVRRLNSSFDIITKFDLVRAMSPRPAK